MGDQIALSELCDQLTGQLISARHWGDASFINLPSIYPSGAFVTVRLSYSGRGVRVSDSGFAFLEAESFGATRSFSRIASRFAEVCNVEHDKKTVFVDVELHEVERAIYDVSSASKMIADRIIENVIHENDVKISEALSDRLKSIFHSDVEFESKIIGSSSTEWEVTAVTNLSDGTKAIYHAVSNYPASVYKASTAFHDIASLDNPPSLISVVSNKSEMGPNMGILSQAGRVIEITQSDDVFLRAAA